MFLKPTPQQINRDLLVMRLPFGPTLGELKETARLYGATRYVPRADGSATEAEQKIATVSASPELTEHLVHLIRTEWRTIRQAVHGWDRRHSIPVTISGATKIPGRHYTHCLNVNTARIALAELIADHRLPGLITDSMIVSKIHSRLSDEQRATDEVVCARDPGCRRHRPSPVLGVCPRRTSA